MQQDGQRRRRSSALASALALLLATSALAVPGDIDDDGVGDGSDNCVDVANPDQRDENGDGYGTACDPDLDGDGLVGPSDFFGGFRPCLGVSLAAQPQCRLADFDGDGLVSATDFFGVLRVRLGGAPGPKCSACPLDPGGPVLDPLPDVMLASGSALHVPLQGSGGAMPLDYAVSSDVPAISATLVPGNRSIDIEVAGFGTMRFQLFEARAARAAQQLIALATAGYYDGTLLDRVARPAGGVPTISGGDPLGVGSPLGPFDDQFSVTLQHNVRGILSMQPPADDENDSRFLITGAAARALDANATMVGILTGGEDVRAAIQAVATDPSDRPSVDVVVTSVRLVSDDATGMLLLDAPEGFSGSATIQVDVSDDQGRLASQSFDVTATPDGIDTAPWLADVPIIDTDVDTEILVPLQAIDVEGDSAFFLDETTLGLNDLPVPAPAPPDLDYAVDFNTGVVRITPQNGLSGVHGITVGTAVDLDAIDYQVLQVRILP